MADPVIALVADHAGFELKNSLNDLFDEHGFYDPRPRSGDGRSRRLSEHGRRAGCRGRRRAGAVRRDDCGSGTGIAIAANRYPWLRVAMCYDVTTARLAREHNNAHVLALGARLIGLEVAYDCLSTFLSTPFAGGRHARRVATMSAVP
jgi:ribose 5-phosphate isomerase B